MENLFLIILLCVLIYVSYRIIKLIVNSIKDAIEYFAEDKVAERKIRNLKADAERKKIYWKAKTICRYLGEYQDDYLSIKFNNNPRMSIERVEIMAYGHTVFLASAYPDCIIIESYIPGEWEYRLDNTVRRASELIAVDQETRRFIAKEEKKKRFGL